MQALTRDLLRKLLDKATRIAILCLGNELKRDDAAGILVGESLEVKSPPDTDVFLAYQSPEAYLFKIMDRDYSHVIIVDAAETGSNPGTIWLIDENEILEEDMSTHRIAIQTIFQFLKKSGKKLIFIGIQRKLSGVGLERSDEILKASEILADMLYEIIKNIKEGQDR